MFEELVGWQIVDLDNNHFIVQSKTGERRTFEFEIDNGDCCGYNELVTDLLIEEQDRNPIIVQVTQERTCGMEDCLLITFYGENKEIAKVNSCSSSGSGWCYGANVTVYCKETKEREILTEW